MNSKHCGQVHVALSVMVKHHTFLGQFFNVISMQDAFSFETVGSLEEVVQVLKSREIGLNRLHLIMQS